MKPVRALVDALPPLTLNDNEVNELQNLTDSFVLGNIEEYLEMSERVRKSGVTPREWRELRQKDDIRVYTQRSKKSSDPAVNEPIVPSLLLFGIIEGSLHDAMYAVAASNDVDIKVKSKFVQDGIVDAKVLHKVVRPSLGDPYSHVNVAWRLYSVPESRDYICVEASGIATTIDGESIGYHIAHSVGFPQLPPFQDADVERGNLSVCSLYRQRAPNSVECYVHGFFDFQEDDTVLSAISMNSMANQWLSFSQLIECAEMKKLNFGLMGTKKACIVCDSLVCSRCHVKKTVCTVKHVKETAILEKKLPVCGSCIRDTLKSNALDIARDEIHLQGCTRVSDWWSASDEFHREFDNIELT
ncbi:hypothetical protein JM18_009209 [Phytophthora kernoviae]|uniref:FYVE-type domain-containing protein n=1 Tax=Phytophthora kernoviae TaxID=325452 RepID=A0A921S9U1_9STRA|nr:hypothetical protein JM18_009209 [Phytophthora kernoviae]